MSEQDGWNNIEVPEEDKIEIEIEQDEPQEVEEEQPVVEAKEEPDRDWETNDLR